MIAYDCYRKESMAKIFRIDKARKKTFEIRLADFEIKEEIEKYGLWVIGFKTSDI